MTLLFLLLACKPDAGAPAPMADRLTTEALLEATRALTEIGPRLAGTENEERARARVEQMMLDAGLSGVESAPFVWDPWQPGGAFVYAGDQRLPAHPLSPSPPTSVTATLTTGAAEAGVIALRSSSDGGRADQFTEAWTGGAEALIRVTEDVDPDGTLLVEVGHTLDGVSFPSVAVDRDVGAALRGFVGAEVTISVDSTTLLDHTSYNVLGRVEGAGAGRVFVIAHYDSWHLSHSAFDNALGVGALIQLAAQLADGPQPEATVVFMATSGEEQGLQGAIAWVSENEDEAEDVDLVITLDALWSAAGTFWVTASDPDWIAAGLEAAAAEGIEAADGGDVSLASDHFPFVTRGVPAIWCTRWRDDHYHTERDTLDQLDMDQAAAAARSQWRLLTQAAGVPDSG